MGNSRNVSAMRYGNEKAREILESPDMAGVREEILELFTGQRLSTTQIAKRINGRMQLRPSVQLETAAGIVRRVIRELVEDDERREISGEQHSRVVLANQPAITEARDEWMQQQGFFVWTPEEAKVLMDLIEQEEYLKPESRQSLARRKKEGNGVPRPRKRKQPVNHALVAAELNRRFNCDKFTKTITSRKVERIRLEQKKREEMN